MQKVIVSLATTSKRLSICRATLMSLVTQSIVPRKVIINVSKEAYLRDDGIVNSDLLSSLISDIPEELRSVFELRWVKNTGPYRKLMPTLQQADDNDIIVTADDDIFYSREWLETLIDNFESKNRVIHAGRVRRKRKNVFGKYMGYIYWPIIKEEEVIKEEYIITFGGGAVLCRNWFSDELINDTNYLNIAPTADDLWYSKLCQHSSLQVKVIPKVLDCLNFFEHNDGLVNQNFPQTTRTISKIKNRAFNRPLNYFRMIRFGNDIAYDSIEEYFRNKY